MKIAFDSCVLINMFSLDRWIKEYCESTGKKFDNLTGEDLCHIVRQDLKIKEIYFNMMKLLKSGDVEAWILPTVYKECVAGSKSRLVSEFDQFLEKFNIKKAVFCQKQVEFCEFVKNKYTSGEGVNAVVVDKKNSKNPYNDSQILAEALVTKSRLVTADEHFLRLQIIFEKNKDIVQHFNLPEELAKNLPIQINQFAKTRLYKSLNKKEKSINK